MCFFAGAVSAQDINRNVDVAKDYLPMVGRAAKLTVKPTMQEVEQLRPDLEYTVRPRAWVERFDVIPMSALYPSNNLERLNPFYARLGGGFPGVSTADVYLSTRRAGASGAGIFVNHRGFWGRLDGFDARTLHNTGGFFGRAHLGNWQIEGELAVDDDRYNDFLLPVGAANRKLHYTTPRGRLDVMHKFLHVGAEGGYLMSTGWNEVTVEPYLSGDFRIGDHQVGMRMALDFWTTKYANALPPLSDINPGVQGRMLHFVPSYVFDHEHFRFGMGLDLGVEVTNGKLLYAPRIEVRVHGAVSPYVRLSGTIDNNNHHSLARANPYLSPDFQYRDSPGATSRHALVGGFTARIARAVSLDVFAGLEREVNPMLTSASEPIFVKRFEAVVAGGVMDVRVNNFTASLEGKYLKHNKFKEFLPSFEGRLDLAYTRGKWSMGAGAEVWSSHKFLNTQGVFEAGQGADWAVLAADAFKIDAAVDISLCGEYFVSKKMAIFLEGSNLADQKIYRFATPHKAPGMSVVAGVKLKM